MTALHFNSVTSPPTSESSTADSNSSVRSLVQTTIASMATSKEANCAELLWAHRVKMCHQSYRSCLGLNGVFKSIYNDSQIAKKFALSKTKYAYLINYGMAPYYKETLVELEERSPILPSHSMRVLIVHSMKNKWIASLDFGMMLNVK